MPPQDANPTPSFGGFGVSLHRISHSCRSDDWALFVAASLTGSRADRLSAIGLQKGLKNPFDHPHDPPYSQEGGKAFYV